MDEVKKELDTAINDLKEVVLRAMDVSYSHGYKDGYNAAMNVIQAIIDGDARYPA